MKILAITILLLFTSCTIKQSIDKENKELQYLKALMHGSFNSEKQAQIDSSYFNISLHMYPIWEERGSYLYVEQALNNTQNRPYRQRIYQLEQVDDLTFKSHIYKIPADSLWVGKWKTPEAFDMLKKKDLIHLNGCEVVLKRLDEDHFKGSTGNSSCKSTLYGASYAQSEVDITSGQVISWDRGFDVNGNHIWGAEKGGYIFQKIEASQL